ncbi:MAG TPA: hypothetical protein VHB79_02605 [Polyangiaceae bacterium]|nr:hypothetical protein [Polyangiaceae bacterium]
MSEDGEGSGISGVTKLIAAIAALITALAGLFGFISGGKKSDMQADLSGSISFVGGKPAASVEMDLIGTPCTARTSVAGYFRFENCTQAAQLTHPRVRIYLSRDDTPCTATLEQPPKASDVEIDPLRCAPSVKPAAQPPPPTQPVPVAPNDGKRYIQLASTTTQVAAVDLAQKQAHEIGARVCVYASRQLFATAAGPVAANEADALATNYRPFASVDDSAFPVMGHTYRPVGNCFDP